jgi:hypothetical protein
MVNIINVLYVVPMTCVALIKSMSREPERIEFGGFDATGVDC